MKWCRLINAESEGERMLIEQDEYIREAVKELDKISGDPKKRAEYDARDKAIKDYITELMEAEERGELRERKTMIQTMYNNGVPSQEISRITSLPLDNIEKIIESINKAGR